MMWKLSREAIIDMVESVKCSKARCNLCRPLLTMGAVVGTVYVNGSAAENGDVFILNKLFLTQEVGFKFKYFMTTEWFILTATPLNDGEGLLNWLGTAELENTICDIHNFNGRVAMVLKQDNQLPLLITVTRADAIDHETLDDKLWITVPDGERREFSPNKFIAGLSLLRAQA